jgi:hypothetical protein
MLLETAQSTQFNNLPAQLKGSIQDFRIPAVIAKLRREFAEFSLEARPDQASQ